MKIDKHSLHTEKIRIKIKINNENHINVDDRYINYGLINDI